MRLKKITLKKATKTFLLVQKTFKICHKLNKLKISLKFKKKRKTTRASF